MIESFDEVIYYTLVWNVNTIYRWYIYIYFFRYGSSYPGSSLLHDSGVLSALRELLVMIRVWAIIHQRPLLHFTVSTSNLDPLLEMFKLLTKVCTLWNSFLWSVRREREKESYNPRGGKEHGPCEVIINNGCGKEAEICLYHFWSKLSID